jgi:hypothetical protein
MSQNKRPDGVKLAQEYFSSLIRDASAVPPDDLDPATARLIRELFQSEQAAAQPAGEDFETIRQRIRQQVRPPVPSAARSGKAASVRPGRGGTASGAAEPDFYPANSAPPGNPAWGKFLVLAGMAATIVLLAGLLGLSLAGLNQSDGNAGRGAKPASIPPVAVTASPTPEETPLPTLGPDLKTEVDWQNPKSLLEAALPVAAKVLKLDYPDLQKRLQSGQSLAEIAKTQGVDLQQVKASLLSSFKTQLGAAIQSGQLTQPQADQTYKAAIPFIDSFVVSTVVVNSKVTPTP